MWNSTPTFKNNVIAAIAVMGNVVAFNTHSMPMEKQNHYTIFHEQTVSNLGQTHWNTTNSDKVEVDSVHEGVVSISEIIALTKVTLGLPNKDVADIFGITRQTLHTYSNGGDLTQNINKHTRGRALALFDIINDVKGKFKNSPGAMAKNYTIEGRSLLDYLTSEKLCADEIIEFCDRLAAKMESNQPPFLGDTKTLYSLTRSA